MWKHLLLTLSAALSLSAQNSQLRGLVSDPSGSSVPGAGIVITNTATGVVRESVSNGQGVYRLPLLPPGKYTMQVTKDGFKSIQQREIVLQIDDLVTLDIHPEVGAQSHLGDDTYRLHPGIATVQP